MKRSLAAVAALVCLAARAPAQTPNSVFAVVNIPAARVDVRTTAGVIASFPVAVGTAQFPTPTGAFAITEIIINPWWIPPPSEWARDARPTPPGPANPMGIVKLLFAPMYYLHGTPDSASVGRPASHGCVRMYNTDAADLARVVAGWSEPDGGAAVDRMLQRNATSSVKLRRPLPLVIVYQRLEITDSIITLHPDPYKRGPPELDAALRELTATFRAATPDVARVRAFLQLRARRSVVIRPNQLMKGMGK